MQTSARSFSRGFVAMLPMWLAAMPVALAYAAAARDAGLTTLEIQLLSLTVYSSAAQIAMMQGLVLGDSAAAVLLTVAVMNVHHVIYGVSLRQRIHFPRPVAPLAAYLLTDAAYGVTIAKPENGRVAYLLGAEYSIFVGWNLSTALAILAGQVMTLASDATFRFAAPLTFFLLLVALVKTRTDVIVMAVSMAAALVCVAAGLGGATTAVVAIVGVAVGVALRGKKDFNAKAQGTHRDAKGVG